MNHEQFIKQRKKEYDAYLKTRWWELMQFAIYKKFNRKCNRCEKKFGDCRFDCHHNSYDNFGKHNRAEFLDLELLCERCHWYHHNPGGDWFQHINELILTSRIF